MNIDQIVKKHVGAYGESSVRFKQPKKERAFNRKIFYECLEPEALMVARQENTRLTMKLTGVALTARGESAGKVSKAIKTAGVVTKQALQKLWDIIVNLVEQIHRGIFGIQKHIKKCKKMLEEMKSIDFVDEIKLTMSSRTYIHVVSGVTGAKEHANYEIVKLIKDFKKVNNVYEQRITRITSGDKVHKVKQPITNSDKDDLDEAVNYMTLDNERNSSKGLATMIIKDARKLKEVIEILSIVINTIDGLEADVAKAKKINRDNRLKFEKIMQLDTEQKNSNEIIKDMETYMSKYRKYLGLFYGRILRSAGADVRAVGSLYTSLKLQHNPSGKPATATQSGQID